MSLMEQALLEVNKDRIVALRRLEEIESDYDKMMSIHPDSLFELVIESGGSLAMANAYRVARIKAEWKPS